VSVCYFNVDCKCLQCFDTVGGAPGRAPACKLSLQQSPEVSYKTFEEPGLIHDYCKTRIVRVPFISRPW